mgnify:FL=1
MRSLRALWILGLLLVVPAGAQDREDEPMKLARLAMEAQMKVGDLLHQKGDHAGALEAYRRALAIYEKAAARGDVDEIVLQEELPEEEIVEEPIETEEIEEEPLETEAVPAGRTARDVRGRASATENAVELGLDWLARHQDEDGRWDCDGFMKHDPADDKCDGPGGAFHDVGVTGLATLAFLGAGFTDRGDAKANPHAKTVARALAHLASVQADDGVLGTRKTHSFMYNHAMGTLALCEALWLTRDPKYRRPAKKAVDFIQHARNPYLAWRYEPRGGENDTHVTTWCVAALTSAKFAGLEVDPGNFAGALAWYEKMTDPNFGQVGYNYPGGTVCRMEGLFDRYPPENSQAITAAAIFGRVLCGEDPRRKEVVRKGADLCIELAPSWNPDDGSIDMVFWYWGTLAMFQMGGVHWRKWNGAMKAAIVKSQHQKGSGTRTGSWDPIDAWGSEGGRVYSTAMMTLCLEVYYRYDRVFGVR